MSVSQLSGVFTLASIRVVFSEPTIVEDSAGSTSPALVTIFCMLFFVSVVPDWLLHVDFMTEFAIESILMGNILPD